VDGDFLLARTRSSVCVDETTIPNDEASATMHTHTSGLIHKAIFIIQVIESNEKLEVSRVLGLSSHVDLELL
jgi:hypothetical protein